MADPTFKNINRFFVLSFKNGAIDPTRISLCKYYMPLVEIKDFNEQKFWWITDEFSVRVTKITSVTGILWTYSLPFCL